MRVRVTLPDKEPFEGRMVIWVGGDKRHPPKWVDAHPQGGAFLENWVYSVHIDGEDSVRAFRGAYLSAVTSAATKA